MIDKNKLYTTTELAVVEEGDGYVGRLKPPGQPPGVGLPSGQQRLVPYPYRARDLPACVGAQASDRPGESL
jgi:hypothetical protein